VEFHRVDDLIGRIVTALRADNGNSVASRDERLALQPYPPVEGYRKILDDYQDPTLHLYRSV
jgi:hypothetical protein